MQNFFLTAVTVVLFVIILNFNWVNDAVIVIFFMIIFVSHLWSKLPKNDWYDIHTHTQSEWERHSNITHTHTHRTLIIYSSFFGCSNQLENQYLNFVYLSLHFHGKCGFHDVQFITTNYTWNKYFSLRRQSLYGLVTIKNEH